jgi:ABC-type polysaccharide/polyol phosphate export permease
MLPRPPESADDAGTQRRFDDGYRGPLSDASPVERFISYRGALRVLSERHLKLRYRRSLLGFAWTLVYPLAATTVLTIIFSNVFTELSSYPLYALVGVLVWHFFSVSCLQASDSLLSAAAIARKVYVPTAVFPLSAVAANVVNLLLCMAVLPTVLYASGVDVTVRPMTLAYAVVTLTVFTAGIALLLSSLNVFYRDVRYFFEAVMLVWFYATPIVYPASALTGANALIVNLNPLYWILSAVRSGFHPWYRLDTVSAVVAGAVACVSAFGGWAIYHRCERRFHLHF